MAPNPQSHPLVHKGPKISVFALRLADGSCPALEFFQNDLSDEEKATLLSLITRLASLGELRNAKRFKKLEGTDKLMEFKDHQVRVFCCFAGKSRMFLLFGLRKQKDRHRPADIKRAERMVEYARKQP